MNEFRIAKETYPSSQCDEAVHKTSSCRHDGCSQTCHQPTSIQHTQMSSTKSKAEKKKVNSHLKAELFVALSCIGVEGYEGVKGVGPREGAQALTIIGR